MDDLQARIAARLTEALETLERTGAEPGPGIALADEGGERRLSLDDVARLAADEAQGWF